MIAQASVRGADLAVSSLLREALTGASPAGVFNQYRDQDAQLDRPDAAARRRENLNRYLDAFREARYVLVGEAAGYGACRFSGVPFTDERLLVGAAALAWAGEARGFGRASHPRRPMLREASASVVWSALGDRRDVALWNVVPWHPVGRNGALSNARPGAEAQRAGLELLHLVLAEVWPSARPIAVGRLAELALSRLGYAGVKYLRHPAHGGAAAFRAGLAELCPQATGP